MGIEIGTAKTADVRVLAGLTQCTRRDREKCERRAVIARRTERNFAILSRFW